MDYEPFARKKRTSIIGIRVNKPKLKSIYKHILYIKKNGDLLVEEPDIGKVHPVPSFRINDYITQLKSSLPWTKTMTGDYIRVKDEVTEHFYQATKELQLVNMHFRLPVSNNFLIPEIREENFKLYKGMDKFGYTIPPGYVVIEATVPIYPLWFYGKCDVWNQEDKVRSTHIFMKINDTLYNWPYGNVTTEGQMCYGSGNSNVHDSIDSLLNTIYLSPANTDYNFSTKHLLCSNSHCPTFDLENISNQIICSHEKSIDVVCYIDLLYYLSNICDYENFNHDTIFIKHTKQNIGDI